MGIQLLSQESVGPLGRDDTNYMITPGSAADITIPAHNRAIVPTDLSIAVPPGTYGRVAPRSGLAVKHFIDTGAGVIDVSSSKFVKHMMRTNGVSQH